LSNPKHTPGPWIVCDSAEIAQANPPHKIVVQFSQRWTKQEKANARLISAAPDMLAALRVMLVHAKTTGGIYTDGGVAMLEAVIQQAEGSK
jgi:hypothetical protein